MLLAAWTVRLPETLKPENRLPLRFDSIVAAGRTVVTNRQTVGYTLAMTFLFGVFMSYLASSELIISDVFNRAEQFPYVFGGLAAVMGAAMLVNAAIVSRTGLQRLVRRVLAGYVVGSAGKLAGTAAAVIGTVSTALGAGLGAILDRTFDGTVLPFTLGLFGCGIVAAGFVLWAGGGAEPETVVDEPLGRAAALGG